MRLNTAKIRKDFPIFQRKINSKPIIYLDSASTSQKPRQVIEAVAGFYRTSNANIHRGIYTISEEATALFEGTREKVAKFINSKDAKEIVFTHNTTEALNIVAYGLKARIKKGDAILLSEMEHHSNIVPWQRIAKEKSVRLLFLAMDDNGVLTNQVKDENDKVVYKHFTDIPKLRIVSLAHVSNVLGTINPIHELILRVRQHAESRSNSSRLRSNNKGPFIVIDAAQSVPHMPIDVQKLDCDFLAFSGHKMLAPTGVGVLWGRRELLEKMEPLLVGSHMIAEVTKKGATWNQLPWKFEPGTAAIEAVVGLGAAIDYLNRIGMDNVREHEKQLVTYALSLITKIDGLTIYGPLASQVFDPEAQTRRGETLRGGVVSFNLKGVHSHDVAQILNEDNICIRSGHHCAMPLHQRLGIESSCRASFYLYNNESDVDKLVEGIKKVKKVFSVR